jgi:hypothetical protein
MSRAALQLRVSRPRRLYAPLLYALLYLHTYVHPSCCCIPIGHPSCLILTCACHQRLYTTAAAAASINTSSPPPSSRAGGGLGSLEAGGGPARCEAASTCLLQHDSDADSSRDLSTQPSPPAPATWVPAHRSPPAASGPSPPHPAQPGAAAAQAGPALALSKRHPAGDDSDDPAAAGWRACFGMRRR